MLTESLFQARSALDRGFSSWHRTEFVHSPRLVIISTSWRKQVVVPGCESKHVWLPERHLRSLSALLEQVANNLLAHSSTHLVLIAWRPGV